jgi:hypothetical protein
MRHATIRKHPRPQDFHSPWTPQQQAEKLTALIQGPAPHTLVTVSGKACFYLLRQPYVTDQGERQWAQAQLLGATYHEAALALNRRYGVALDPERGNSW